MSIRQKFFVFSCALLAAACAAKLPQEVSKNRPIAIESPLNLDEIQFTKLADGSPVVVGPYMREHNLKWLVLSFGSQSCGACMQKARYFQANLVNNYDVLGEAANGTIELHGVMTDPSSSREEVLALVQDERLTHLSWADAGDDKVMMKYFQPAGLNFSVPLTVMLSRDGIVWRVSSKDKLSAPEILKKIADTIGTAGTAVPPEILPPPGPIPTSRALLSREVPERLSDVAIRSCLDRRQTTLGAELPVVKGGLRAVVVHKENCGESSACVEAKSKLKAWAEACSNLAGRSCEVKDLVIGGTMCADEEAFAGGQEFFDVFADHFTWAYSPKSAGPGRWELPEIKGPLTFVFDEAGRLVFSREGMLGEALSQRMASDGLQNLAEGPDFPLHWNEAPAQSSSFNADINFSTLRRRAKYTLMMFWNRDCGSCIEELQEWHREQDSALKFCSTRSAFCQVVAVETERGESEVSPNIHLDDLIKGDASFDGWNRLNWTMSLSVERDQLPDGRAPMGWFKGWVRAKYASSEPRIVLYDREGKVVSHWRSLPGEYGPRDTIKALFDNDQ